MGKLHRHRLRRGIRGQRTFAPKEIQLFEVALVRDVHGIGVAFQTGSIRVVSRDVGFLSAFEHDTSISSLEYAGSIHRVVLHVGEVIEEIACACGEGKNADLVSGIPHSVMCAGLVVGEVSHDGERAVAGINGIDETGRVDTGALAGGKEHPAKEHGSREDLGRDRFHVLM